MDDKRLELIELIKAKFGSIPRFCQIAGLDMKRVRPALYRNQPFAKEMRKEIKKKAEKLEDRFLPNELTPQQAEAIRVAVKVKYNFASRFYQTHPQFKSTFVSNVLNGVIREKSDRVREMAQILEVKLD